MIAPDEMPAGSPPLAVANLANAVLDGRRNLGMSVPDVARAVGIDEASIHGLETGDEVPGDVARRVLDALGLPWAPYLPGTPQGAVPVPPTDGSHRQVMGYLAYEARSDEGWVLFPDVVAYVGAMGAPRGGKARDGDGSVSRLSRRLLVGGAVVGASCAFARFLGVGTDAPPHPWMAAWATLSLLLMVSSLFVGLFSMLRRDLPTDAPPIDVEGAARDMRNRAVVVTRTGVVTYVTSPEGLSRRVHHARSVTGIEVRQEDRAHVTLRLRTPDGIVEAPWVPAVREVLDVVASWGVGRMTSEVRQ